MWSLEPAGTLGSTLIVNLHRTVVSFLNRVLGDAELFQDLTNWIKNDRRAVLRVFIWRGPANKNGNTVSTYC